MIGVIVGILFQFGNLTPIAISTLAIPTPYLTPTPVTISTIQPQDQVLGYLATAQAQSQAVPTQIAVQNNQIYVNGRPMLPNNSDTSQILGYGKWALSSGSYSLTGPLSPIVIHLGVFVALAVASLLFKFITTAVIFIYHVVWWIIDKILRLIPFIG